MQRSTSPRFLALWGPGFGYRSILFPGPKLLTTILHDSLKPSKNSMIYQAYILESGPRMYLVPAGYIWTRVDHGNPWFPLMAIIGSGKDKAKLFPNFNWLSKCRQPPLNTLIRSRIGTWPKAHFRIFIWATGKADSPLLMCDGMSLEWASIKTLRLFRLPFIIQRKQRGDRDPGDTTVARNQ